MMLTNDVLVRVVKLYRDEKNAGENRREMGNSVVTQDWFYAYRVLLDIPVVHVSMIDLRALFMNNFEHRVFRIEPTAVHRRCARRREPGRDVLSDTECCA